MILVVSHDYYKDHADIDDDDEDEPCVNVVQITLGQPLPLRLSPSS